jgi:hypothetical protein
MSSGNMRSQGSNSRASDSDTMTEDQVDALWVLVRPTLDLLASHVIPSVAPPPCWCEGVVVVVVCTIVLLLLCK